MEIFIGNGFYMKKSFSFSFSFSSSLSLSLGLDFNFNSESLEMVDVNSQRVYYVDNNMIMVYQNFILL